MMRAWLLIAIVMALLALGAARARYPYTQPIEKEDGSFGGIVVEITLAEQADIMAQGYDRWGLMGKQIYIEATAENRTEEAQDFKVEFSARSVFDRVLDSCETTGRLAQGERLQLKCTLQAKDVRDFYKVTYKVTRSGPEHEEGQPEGY